LNSIIISPSGNLYGSEQVLIDYLETASLCHKVYIPANSLLEKYFKSKNIYFKKFFNLISLYSFVIMDLIFNNFQFVYINEAAHSKYISLLAKLFKRKNFIVHIRLLEDCNRNRYPFGHLSNIQFITVSDYISNKFPFQSLVLLDGYPFSNMLPWKHTRDSKIKIGIIGRITKTKGFDIFKSLYSTISHLNIEIHFFGDISKDVSVLNYLHSLPKSDNIILHGFVTSKDDIYTKIDLVLHLNKQEPLGRIFFEALDYGVPFIGFRSGGIGEIANKINYPLLVADESINFNQHVLDRLVLLSNQSNFNFADFEIARQNAIRYFSTLNYSKILDQQFQ